MTYFSSVTENWLQHEFLLEKFCFEVCKPEGAAFGWTIYFTIVSLLCVQFKRRTVSQERTRCHLVLLWLILLSCVCLEPIGRMRSEPGAHLGWTKTLQSLLGLPRIPLCTAHGKKLLHTAHRFMPYLCSSGPWVKSGEKKKSNSSSYGEKSRFFNKHVRGL